MRYEPLLNFTYDEVVVMMASYLKQESGKSYIIRKTDSGFTAVEDKAHGDLKVKDVFDLVRGRTRNCLWVYFFGKHDDPISTLLSTTPESLSKIRNFGKDSYADLVKAVSTIIGNHLSYPLCSDLVAESHKKVFK
jgi:hypothetical protein